MGKNKKNGGAGEETTMQNTIAYSQPLSEQQKLSKPAPRVPLLGTALYGMEWLVGVSCTDCVPSQYLVQPQPCLQAA